MAPSNVPRDYSPATRVEPIPKASFPHASYPRWIGHKFTPAGDVLPFPGNTVICHLSPTSHLHARLTELHDELRSASFASSLALLPPSSYHMTLYEGISYQIPETSQWPAGLSLNCSLPECHAFVTSALARFSMNETIRAQNGSRHINGTGHNGNARHLATDTDSASLADAPTSLVPPYKLRISSFEALTDGVALCLDPSTPQEEQRLRRLRSKLAKAVGLQHPGFEEYSFHLSVAYLLKWLSEDETRAMQGVLDAWLADLTEEERTFELGTPEVCVYDDMCGFRRVFYLGEEGRVSSSQ